jgi:hypothetical protein
MRISTLFTATVAILALSTLAGCDKDKEEGDSSAKATDTAAADKGEKGEKGEKGGGEMAAVCEKMCTKTVDCAVDVAKAAGVPEEMTKTAKADAEKGLSECTKSCSEETKKVTDKEKAELAKVKDCLKKDCGEYVKCMEAIK